MTATFQLVIDCADPEPLARFWVAALGYEFEPPPDGYDNWDDYWRAVGVSEDELGLGLDCIVDPARRGPRIWFQVVPEKKSFKNRLHLDIHTDDLDAEVARLERLGAERVQKVQTWQVMRDPAGLLFCVLPMRPGSLTDENARRWE